MSVSTSGGSRLYALLLAVVVVAGALMASTILLLPPHPEPTIRLIPLQGEERVVTLTEMRNMEYVERNGSYQNSYGNIRGQGLYRGVRLADLILLIGGMNEQQILVVNASDGYSQVFTYRNVYPNATQYAIQGDMVLAYQLNGTMIPEYEEGPKIMFLPEDGCYSNADAAATIDPQFFTGAAGPKLVSRVASISIRTGPPAPEPVVLHVTVGTVTKGYTYSQVTSLASVRGEGGTRNKFGTLRGPYNVTGVPVLDILRDVADLPDDYNLTVVSSDSYMVTHNRSVCEGTVKGYDPVTGTSVGPIHALMVLAYLVDDQPVQDGPFMIAMLNDTYFTDSYIWSRFVVNLTVTSMSAGGMSAHSAGMNEAPVPAKPQVATTIMTDYVVETNSPTRRD
ncbi:MAG: hypothetical protein QXQ81_09075 [Candidatus Thorarchaeota archaeon]